MAGRDTPPDLEDAPVYGQDGVKSSYNTQLDGDMLDPDFAKKLGREIFNSSTNWLNQGKRLRWSNSLRAFQGLHPADSKYLSTDYRYRSRLFRPKTRAMVRKAEASTAEAFFANEDVVNIQAQDDNDPKQQASAEINKALIQWRLTNTIPWFLTLVGARQDAEVMGICIGKAFWKYAEKKTGTIQRPKLDAFGLPILNENGEPDLEDYDQLTKTQDHPWVDLLAAENFRFDAGADWRNPIATSPYTIEMIPMYVADVKEKIESGDWLPVSDSAIMGSTNLDDDTTRRSRENGRVPGKDNDAGKPRQFDICWIRENIIRYKGKDWHFYSLSFGGELLTEPCPLDEVYLHGIRPYVVGFVLPEAHKVYPTSKVELIKDLQTQTNDVINLRLDNVKLALNPRQFIKAGQGIDPQDMRTFMPGKTVITTSKDDPRNSIMWDRPPEVTASSYQEQERLDMDFDELIGGTSNSSMQANPQAYKAVGNMEMMDGNASQLEEYDQRVFVETFVEPLVKHLIKLEQHYETDATLLAIAGQKAQLYQKFGLDQITDDLLNQDLTVRVNVGIGATNPEKKLKNFITAGQALGELFGPLLPQAIEPEECIKEVFSNCGYKDGQRFFKPNFDWDAAMQNMQQGKKGDDVQGKIQLAQATQQAQAQQDIESHRMEMKENERQHQFKMEEMFQKFQLEMAKMNNKPAPSVQLHSDALTKSSQNIEGMAHKHEGILNNLGAILPTLADVANKHGHTLEQLLHHNAAMQQGMHHGFNSLAEATNRLAQAHSKPRKTKAIRDDKGKIIGAEEYA